MLSLIRRRKERADPAPSRWAWRVQRLMLTPGVRLGLRVGLPFAVMAAVGTWLLSNPDNRAAVDEMIADVRASIEERPEFSVQLMAIDGVKPALAEQIRGALPLDFPVSSFDLDLDQMRDTITQIPTIRRASVRIRPGGVLQIDAEPRVAVALWRGEAGLIEIDIEGNFIADITHRDMRPNLPLIAGDGARANVAEAMSLIDVAAPLGARLRGLVRQGARRWDVVLDRGQRIMLPEENPRRALERAIALDHAQELLARDVAAIDLRLPRRPTIRMNNGAITAWRSAQKLSGEQDKE